MNSLSTVLSNISNGGRKGTAREYICHPATFLNGKRWENDYQSDDSSQPAKGAGNNARQSQTSLAMASAVKQHRKNRGRWKVKTQNWVCRSEYSLPDGMSEQQVVNRLIRAHMQLPEGLNMLGNYMC